MAKSKIGIVLGTRPEIIKLAPLIWNCEEKKREYFVIHTGQHYSYEMDKLFFEELQLPLPKYNLGVGSRPQGAQTGFMLEEVEKRLMLERPDWVIVQGDTNSALAGALAATKLNIKVAHVEAGLRSYDWRMPEEKNRIIIDHISDMLLAPTHEAAEILKKENIPQERIKVVGNTIVDAVYRNAEQSEKKGCKKKELGLKTKEYTLVTLHRQENVDDPTQLSEIIKGISLVGQDAKMRIIFPMHPRTKKRIEEQGIVLDSIIEEIEPVGYLDFLQLEKDARLVMTDSGGVQEEACILGIPCVTIRESTERPETVRVGGNMVVGTNAQKIREGTQEILNKKPIWKQPFGDGKSAQQIMDVLQ